MEKGKCIIKVNPKDMKEAEKLLGGDAINNAFDKASEFLTLHSFLSTVFQSITVSGFLIARGPSALFQEMTSRSFPDPPEIRLANMESLLAYSRSNLSLIQDYHHSRLVRGPKGGPPPPKDDNGGGGDSGDGGAPHDSTSPAFPDPYPDPFPFGDPFFWYTRLSEDHKWCWFWFGQQPRKVLDLLSPYQEGGKVDLFGGDVSVPGELNDLFRKWVATEKGPVAYVQAIYVPGDALKDKLGEDDELGVACAQKLPRFSSQALHVGEAFAGAPSPSKYVEEDDLGEPCLYLMGRIEEVVAKADKIAQELQQQLKLVCLVTFRC